MKYVRFSCGDGLTVSETGDNMRVTSRPEKGQHMKSEPPKAYTRSSVGAAYFVGMNNIDAVLTPVLQVSIHHRAKALLQSHP